MPDPGFIKSTVPVVPALPTWIDPTWAPYTVHEIANTNYGTAPGSIGQLFDFSGLAACIRVGEERLVNVANGGHAICSENPVHGIMLRDNVPTWTLLRDKSSPAAINDANNDIFGVDAGHNTDGLPAAAHNYHNCAVIGSKAIRLHCQNRGYLGGNWYGSDAFNLTALEWDLPPGTGFPAFTVESSGMDHVCQDPGNEDLYMQAGSPNVYRYRNLAEGWVKIATGPSNHAWQHIPGAFDTLRRRRIAVFGYWPWDTASSPGRLYWHDLAANTWDIVPLIADPIHGLPIGWELDAATYDPDNDLIAYCAQDPNAAQGTFALWTIHPVTGQVTWKAQLPTAGAGPCRGRFEHFRGLKGIVYIPNNANMRYIRTAQQ
jgi:hypothetical protein